jgi:hypothetical protein
LKAPIESNLPVVWVEEVDANGDVILDADGFPVLIPSLDIASLDISCEFDNSDENADICEQSAFINAGAVLEIPYCKSKGKIVVNKNVTSKKKK